MNQTLMFADMEPEATFVFPEPLAERYRPQRIAEFAGLTEVKKILAGFVARPTNAGFIFYGPAGTGKTSMALALASELRGFVHHVGAGRCTVETIRDLVFSCWYVPPSGYARHVIVVDEADVMSQAAQLAILSYLDGTETIPDTVWIFTCNATDRLADRFMSRNRVLTFSTYGIQADAAKLLESVWAKEANGKPAPNCARIIKDALGNVRAALMSLEMKLLSDGGAPC